MPTNVAARMTLAADPRLAAGRRRGGDPRRRPGRARHVGGVRAPARGGRRPGGSRARGSARRAAGCPGFGHPVHKPLDPRAERILELADERGVSGPHVARARALRDAVAEVWGKPLTMNVSMPIAAVLLDLGFPAVVGEGGPDPRAHREPARAPGRGAGAADRLRARARRRRRRSSTPRCSTPRSSSPWEEQLGLDDASFRDQLAYLLERSAFYREKLAGRSTAAASPTIAELPLTEKDELRATRTPENPFGAHLCVPPSEIVRIYSTSGTTGDAELHPAHGGRPRQLGDRLGAQLRGLRRRRRPANRLDLQRRPVRRGRRARRLRAHRPHAHPGRHREHRAAGARDRAASTRGRGADAVVRGVPRRERSTSATRASSACSSRASRAAASRRSARRLEEGWGAKVTEAMGIGDIGVSLWGECEEQDGMHLGARGFVHAELIDPETGAALDARRRRHRRARADAPAAPRGAAAPLPHARPRPASGRARAPAAAPARGSAASGEPTTC